MFEAMDIWISERGEGSISVESEARQPLPEPFSFILVSLSEPARQQA